MKGINIFSIRCIAIILLITSTICGQFNVAPGEGKPTVAILDFEARGVSLQEVQTLSERMRTEIGNTNAVRLIHYLPTGPNFLIRSAEFNILNMLSERRSRARMLSAGH